MLSMKFRVFWYIIGFDNSFFLISIITRKNGLYNPRALRFLHSEYSSSYEEFLKSYAKLSHHQLQDAIDVGLATQALIHKVRFDIKQSRHQLQKALDIGLATHLVGRCLCCQADV